MKILQFLDELTKRVHLMCGNCHYAQIEYVKISPICHLRPRCAPRTKKALSTQLNREDASHLTNKSTVRRQLTKSGLIAD